VAFDSRLLAGIGVMQAVVESGSFVRAGEALGLTPSGVSRAVARLEARIGVRLFDRSPRAVALTEEGRRFHAQVAPLLAGIEEAASDAAGAAAKVRGRLRVNVDPWFARLVLAPRLVAFLAAHPALAVDLIVRDTIGDLVAEGFDAAVRFGEPEASGVIARKLLETRILACAAPAYLARCGTPAHPLDLEGHECLLYRDPVTGRPFPWEFHSRAGEVVEVRATGRLVTNDLATKLAAAWPGTASRRSSSRGWRRRWRGVSWCRSCRTGRRSGIRSTPTILPASACRRSCGPFSISWWRAPPADGRGGFPSGALQRESLPLLSAMAWPWIGALRIEAHSP
jgi:DNA-binding transcriptional LysR family regulator